MKIKMCSRREDGRYGFGFGVRVLHGFALGCYLEIIYPSSTRMSFNFSSLTS